MKELIEIKKEIESVVLVGLITEKQSEEELKEYLDELSFLVETAGGNEIKRFVQRLKKADSRSFVGTGKLREIAAYCKENEIDTVVFDDELSPSQIRNIEQVLKIKILDGRCLGAAGPAGRCPGRAVDP